MRNISEKWAMTFAEEHIMSKPTKDKNLLIMELMLRDGKSEPVRCILYIFGRGHVLTF